MAANSPIPPAGERTLQHLLRERAVTHGDRPFATLGGTTHSYAEVLDLAARRALTLRQAGVEQGDRVIALLPNGRDLVELFFACIWSGAILVPVNTASKGPQLAHILENAEPALVVTDAGLAAQLASLNALPDATQAVWEIGDGPASRIGQLEGGPPPGLGDALEPAGTRPGDASVILYTSGTTGPPKGVVCPQAQFWWWGHLTGAALGISEDDVLYTCLPLFHTNALNTLVQAMVAGAHVVVGERFSASRFWSTLAECEATVTYILGAMASILASREPDDSDRAHRVRTALSPATDPALWPVFRERFGIELVEGHGMTETNLVIGPRGGEQRPGWMGRVMPGFSARVVDEDDAEMPTGMPGELVVRADEPFVFATGYWRMPEATVDAYRNLWFHTGDRVTRDAEGWFQFLDRIKDAIRRRGENISAWEVEQALNSHPNVIGTAAVPVASPLGEDDVMAFVVCGEGNTVDPVDLTRWAETRLPYYAVPRYLEFLDALPLTENGKIKKYVLRSRGLSASTWDREAAGVKLRR